MYSIADAALDGEIDEGSTEKEGEGNSTPSVPALPTSKAGTPPEAAPSTPDQPLPAKRKRGRPRKIKPPAAEQSAAEPVLNEGMSFIIRCSLIKRKEEASLEMT